MVQTRKDKILPLDINKNQKPIFLQAYTSFLQKKKCLIRGLYGVYVISVIYKKGNIFLI